MVSLLSFWRRLPLPWRRWRVVETVSSGADIPETLGRRTAVLVAVADRPTWVAFDCPCSEHHRVMLNLDIGRRPHWRLLDGKRLTLAPSVDEIRGSKRCHYFVRRGKIEWV